MDEPVKCDMCDFLYNPRAATVFFNHIKLKHQLEKGNFYTTCKLSGCVKLCVTFSAYRNHWYRVHNPKSNHGTTLPHVAPFNEHLDDTEGDIKLVNFFKRRLLMIFIITGSSSEQSSSDMDVEDQDSYENIGGSLSDVFHSGNSHYFLVNFLGLLCLI